MSLIQHWITIIAAILICCSLGLPGKCDSRSFTLWQLPPHGPSQLMMSYVIRTVHGHVIAIDGGIQGDAAYLTSFLKGLGGKVDAWFITHPHSDHSDALAAILEGHSGLNINRIYASLPDEDFVRLNEPDSLPDLLNIKAALSKSNNHVINLVLGAHFEVDGVNINVLGIRNPELTMNAMNNSSVVLRVSDKYKSVLFLADLGLEAGEKLLHSRFNGMLHCDYVQMAHHGQNGVGKDVYEAIKPSACLWPTPDWLWDNDTGKGKGSGPWKTLEVRQWMESMGVTRNFIAKDGLSEID